MKPPKLLPWIARKANLPEALALKLWRRAAAETEHRVGNAHSATYYAAAMDRFLLLIEEESGLHLPAPDQTAWMWRYQHRMAGHSLTAAQSATRWWENLARGFWPTSPLFRRPSCTV